MASTVQGTVATGLTGVSAAATNNDTLPDTAITDPFSTCQSFPELVDEWAVRHMTGLVANAPILFTTFTGLDGDTSSSGLPMLRRACDYWRGSGSARERVSFEGPASPSSSPAVRPARSPGGSFSWRPPLDPSGAGGLLPPSAISPLAAAGDVAGADGVANPKATAVLLCGMKGMSEGVKAFAEEAGIPEDRVWANF